MCLGMSMALEDTHFRVQERIIFIWEFFNVSFLETQVISLSSYVSQVPPKPRAFEKLPFETWDEGAGCGAGLSGRSQRDP